MTIPTQLRGAFVALSIFTLAGCATVPPPDVSAPAPVVVIPPPAPALPSEPPSAAALQPLPQPLAAPPAADAASAPATAASAPVSKAEAALAPSVESVPPEDPRARDDLWQRVRTGFRMPELDNDLVRRWEHWYASRPEYVGRMTERGGRYLFHIVEEVEKRGLPAELALLPFIESAFNPTARSSASASGIWQFMPATGRDFELRQNVFRDDRRGVLASTRAALDYLQALHRMFGDWHLALAAYNWGQGNVQRALKRAEREGVSAPGYEALRMPDETRNYVPKLQAVKNLVLRPEAFSLVLPPLQNHPFFLTVPIRRDIDVALAARLSGLPLDEFQALNPQMNQPVILANGTEHVLLPYDHAQRFQREVAAHRGPFASWTAWTAPRTMKPDEAARLAGVSEAQLREVNRIPNRMLVRSGSVLVVPRGARQQEDVAEHIAHHASLSLAPEPRARAKGRTARVAKGGKVSGKVTLAGNGPVMSRPVAKAAPSPKRSAKPAPGTRERVAQGSAAVRR